MTESFKLQQQLRRPHPRHRGAATGLARGNHRPVRSRNGSLQAQKADFDALRELEKTARRPWSAVRAAARTARAGWPTARTVAASCGPAMPTARPTGRGQYRPGRRTAGLREKAPTAPHRKSSTRATAAPPWSPSAPPEESLHQANVLLEAIARAAQDLDDARQQPGIRRRRRRTGPRPGQGHDRRPASIPNWPARWRRLEAACPGQAAVAGAGSIRHDVRERLEDGHRAAGRFALAGIRDSRTASGAPGRPLQQRIMSAQAQITATSDYIQARRGGVRQRCPHTAGRGRTEPGLCALDCRHRPRQALQYAQQATPWPTGRQLAQHDVDHFGGMGGFGGGCSAAGGAAWAARSSAAS